MSVLTNPRFAPTWILCLSVGAIAIGGTASSARLMTAFERHNSGSIASLRAEDCRILPITERVELGGYYFQPTMNTASNLLSGSVLPGGINVCDWYGGSGQTVEGGYLQWVVQISDPTEINKTLAKRLQSDSNPDRFPQSQIRRDWSKGVFSSPSTDKKPDGFFNPGGSN